jgi:hypothetical protein
MSRIYPDASTSEASAEIQKYLDGVSNNEPGLLLEMFGPPEWRLDAQERVPPGQHPLYCGGPLVTHHMETFAAKFGFAMHFEFTGQPVGTAGAVAVRWYSNADVLEGNFPMDAWDVLGPPTTLKQGKFHVSDQFEYAWATDENDTVGMFLGTFRRSFAVLAFTSAKQRDIFARLPDSMRIWKPGDLTG